ncbi:MAG TPA: TrkH family potassium uptake protein [Candidatus Ozemobacteraceae bacterium]|nr:TrkH family potassium uptake protein [Candidatus Ozemobacteraceae bacterium]
MIRFGYIVSVVGLVMQGFAALMAVPLLLAIAYGEKQTFLAFAACFVVSASIGRLAMRCHPDSNFDDLGRMEGMGVVTFGWLAVAICGAIPYLFFKLGPIDALFESMSGFTTTGATTFQDFALYPPALFFYRGYTQWLGGVGILVLFVAVLPHLAVSGRQLFFAETSAASKDKLTPRISDTARRLWGWYFLLTLLQTVLMGFYGMPWNDSFANAFATMAAGGFSPHPQSIMGYANPAVEWIIILFMFLAGANFTLQVRALRGNLRALWDNAELRFYLVIITWSSAILTLILARSTPLAFTIDALRAALFQNLSILTTTGFATHDFNLWSDSAKTVLLVLMFIGGCSGSAGGGIKVIRLLLLLRYIGRAIIRAIHPKAIITIKLGKRVFSESEVQPILSFIFLYFCFFAVGGTIAALIENNLIVGYTGAIATLGNIGPGFGLIGPMGSFGTLHPVTKLLYTVLMWAGRLEIIALVVFMSRETWSNMRFCRRD